MRYYVLTIVMMLSIISVTTDVTRAASSINEEQARLMIQNMASEALGSIRLFAQDEISRSEFRDRFRDLLIHFFDIQWIGRFVLGRYYRNATPEQRQEYLDLFLEFILNTYTDRFKTYANEELRVTSSRLDTGGRYAFVSSEILLDNTDVEPVTIVWRVHTRNEHPQVVDIEIKNVRKASTISLASTIRKEFTTILRRNDGRIQKLLDELKQMLQRQIAE